MKNPVLAAQFSNPMQANIACGMLESAGIAAFVVTDEMATLYGAGSTWAPVHLYVEAADLEQATALLKEHGDI